MLEWLAPWVQSLFECRVDEEFSDGGSPHCGPQTFEQRPHSYPGKVFSNPKPSNAKPLNPRGPRNPTNPKP